MKGVGKKWACHAPLNFKKEMVVSQSILGLEEVSRCQNDEKVIAGFLLISFCSSLNGFCSISLNVIFSCTSNHPDV